MGSTANPREKSPGALLPKGVPWSCSGLPPVSLVMEIGHASRGQEHDSVPVPLGASGGQQESRWISPWRALPTKGNAKRSTVWTTLSQNVLRIMSKLLQHCALRRVPLVYLLPKDSKMQTKLRTDNRLTFSVQAERGDLCALPASERADVLGRDTVQCKMSSALVLQSRPERGERI